MRPQTPIFVGIVIRLLKRWCCEKSRLAAVSEKVSDLSGHIGEVRLVPVFGGIGSSFRFIAFQRGPDE